MFDKHFSLFGTELPAAGGTVETDLAIEMHFLTAASRAIYILAFMLNHLGALSLTIKCFSSTPDVLSAHLRRKCSFACICPEKKCAFTTIDKPSRKPHNGQQSARRFFWGQDEWHNFHTQIRRVFPEREPQEIGLDHPIFHSFYDIEEKPQVPSIGHALGGRDSGRTWERDDAREVRYKALYDDKGRMMAVCCHNTDLADGWEREGENEYYYREFSLKKAYPMGMNIVVYALTH